MRRLFTIILLFTIFLPISSAAASIPTHSSAATTNRAGAPLYAIPKFSIINVVQNTEVTIKTFNFPAGKDFNVTMGVIATKAIGGTLIGTQNSGDGGTFIATYPIPAELHAEEIISIRLQSLDSGHHAYNWFYNTDGDIEPGPVVVPLAEGVFPTFDIVEVNSDVDVTVQTQNLTAGDVYIVTMGLEGTNGKGGIISGSQDSGGGGSITATFPIPVDLIGQEKIAIRMASPISGYFAYNLFDNVPTSGGAAIIPAGGVAPLAPGVIPTFTIDQVVADISVTITGTDFTLNDTYSVILNDFGTLGIDGLVIANQTIDSSGVFTGTYALPAEFVGNPKIAIRLESNNTPYYSYNWFDNITVGGGGSGGVIPATPALPPGIFPTIDITAVSQDNTVTVHGQNFTMDDTYTILMGILGTQGVGGIVAGSHATDATGEFTETFTIPAALVGTAEIAIRFESDTTPYFAYNLFPNVDTP